LNPPYLFNTQSSANGIHTAYPEGNQPVPAAIHQDLFPTRTILETSPPNASKRSFTHSAYEKQKPADAERGMELEEWEEYAVRVLEELSALKAKTKATTQKVADFVCSHCEKTETPQWRRGPLGPRTLCNSCGLRYSQKKKLKRDEKGQIDDFFSTREKS